MGGHPPVGFTVGRLTLGVMKKSSFRGEGVMPDGLVTRRRWRARGVVVSNHPCHHWRGSDGTMAQSGLPQARERCLVRRRSSATDDRVRAEMMRLRLASLKSLS